MNCNTTHYRANSSSVPGDPTVQKIFKVKVEAVRTAIYHGKFRRRGRAEGFRRDWKKAYVKLAAGEKMIEYADNL